MDSKPTVILELLSILVSPETSMTGTKLEDIFLVNIENLLEKVQSSEKCKFLLNLIDEKSVVKDCPLHHEKCFFDVRWKFIHWNLELLKLLCLVLEEAMIAYDQDITERDKRNESKFNLVSPDVFSFSQKKVISLSLQFVFSLGISPCLLPGVGIPITARTQFSHVFEEVEYLENEEKANRLRKCVNVIVGFISKPSLDVIRTLIISKHLNDLLAALFQICFAPVQFSSGNQHSNVTFEVKLEELNSSELLFSKTKYSSNQTVQETLCFKHVYFKEDHLDLDFYREKLYDLLNKSFHPMIIRELLLLQSGTRTNQSTTKEGDKYVRRCKTPVWLKTICGSLLHEFIMKPFGIKSVFIGLLDETLDGSFVPVEGKSLSINWQKSDAVAKIIVDCPLQGGSIESYYECIAAQVLDLLRVTSSHITSYTLAKIMILMLYNETQLTERFLIQPLTKPLLSCLESSAESLQTSGILINEKDLSICIEDIERVFVQSSELDCFVKYFEPIIPVIFSLYSYTRNSVTYLKNSVENIIKWIFNQLDVKTSILYFENLSLFSNTENSAINLSKMQSCFSFEAANNGGVHIVFRDIDEVCQDIISQSTLVSMTVVNLISLVQQRDEIAIEMILHCLKKLTDLVSTEVDMESKSQFPQMPFMTRDYSMTKDGFGFDASEIWKRNLSLLTLLELLCEKFSHLCLTKATQIFSFVQATLERGIQVLQSTSNFLFGVFESETLTLAMGLLTALLSDHSKLTTDEWNQAEELLPLLQHIANDHPINEVQEMAMDLKIAIATHGFVVMDSIQHEGNYLTDIHSKKQKKKATATSFSDHSEKVKSNLIEEILFVDTLMNNGTKESQSIVTDEILKQTEEVLHEMNIHEDAAVTNEKVLSENQESFNQAMTELCDPLVPVRGHGLIMLHKLIEKNSEETLNKKEIILKICRINLNHTDSYIYLNAILAMSALAEKCPEFVLPCVVEDYSKSTTSFDGRAEVRMKVGEILVKTSVSLGELLPHYRDLLLSSVLTVTKDPDPFIRASAVSNLGHICQLLHYSLGSVIYEVFNCIKSLVKSDSNVEVRRAAAMFSTLLMRGLSKDSFKVLDGIFLDFYRLLKHVYQVDKDDTVRLHVLLTLEELDEIMKNFLFPKETFTKQIHVLDPATAQFG